MKNIVITILENLLGDLKADNTNLSEEEMLKVAKCLNEINTIQKTEFSKKEAYDYLHMSRASFDNKVREGKIPKGKKFPGKLVWYKKDLDAYVNKEKKTNTYL